MFSKRLAEILSVSHIEMDSLYWGPDWEAATDEELFSKLSAAIEGHSWVLDGNYTRSTPIKWAKADCVIWLDFPYFQTVSRVLTRAVKRAMTREEIWEGTGNRESLQKCFFSKESIVLWAMQTYSKNKRKYEAMMEDQAYENIRFIRLRSSRECDSLLMRFENAIFRRAGGSK